MAAAASGLHGLPALPALDLLLQQQAEHAQKIDRLAQQMATQNEKMMMEHKELAHQIAKEHEHKMMEQFDGLHEGLRKRKSAAVASPRGGSDQVDEAPSPPAQRDPSLRA